jgi:hypothetical protein
MVREDESAGGQMITKICFGFLEAFLLWQLVRPADKHECYV